MRPCPALPRGGCHSGSSWGSASVRVPGSFHMPVVQEEVWELQGERGCVAVPLAMVSGRFRVQWDKPCTSLGLVHDRIWVRTEPALPQQGLLCRSGRLEQYPPGLHT